MSRKGIILWRLAGPTMGAGTNVKTESQDYELVFLVLTSLFLVALLYSIFLLSVSMICFGILALFDLRLRPFHIRWRKTFPWDLAKIMEEPTWWIISVPFFLVLLGAFYSDDSIYWITRMRIKLPFALFPLAFFLLPPISRSCYQQVHLLLLIVMTLSTFPIIWQIGFDYHQVLEKLQQGQPIDTPGNHIRYSLLTALASISGFLLWEKNFFSRDSWKSKAVLGMSVLLTIFLHILAVRSGLAAFYLSAIILIVKKFFERGWSNVLALLLVGIITIPLLAYQIIPTLGNRMQYMLEDVSQYQSQKWNDYSDAERILSIKAGLHIGKKNWLFGVGPGDLREEMRIFFYHNFDKDTFILPHNQFVTILAASGAVGLIFFLISLFLPLFGKRHYQNEWFLTAYAIILFSLLVENTFETSVGVAIFLFFALVGLNSMKAIDDIGSYREKE